jgi:hypothetical protein
MLTDIDPASISTEPTMLNSVNSSPANALPPPVTFVNTSFALSSEQLSILQAGLPSPGDVAFKTAQDWLSQSDFTKNFFDLSGEGASSKSFDLLTGDSLYPSLEASTDTDTLIDGGASASKLNAVRSDMASLSTPQDFTTDFNVYGNTQVNGSAIQLTASRSYVAGTAFTKNAIPLTDENGNPISFSVQYQFTMPSAGGIGDADGVGADGLTFAIAASPTVGQVGIGLGYGGTPRSIAVEYDTYNNGIDDNGHSDNNNGNHIGIDVNGNLNSVAFKPISTRLNDGGIWNNWVDYNAETKVLEVRLSQSSERPSTADLSYSVDLSAVLASNQAYLGFTASTGSGYEQHQINSFKFSGNEEPNANGIDYEPARELGPEDFTLGGQPKSGINPAPTFDVTVISRPVRFSIYDYGTRVDNDLVRVLVNGKDISSIIELPRPDNAKQLQFIPTPGKNTIEVEAITNGNHFPNTAAIFLDYTQMVYGRVNWEFYQHAGSKTGFTLGYPQIQISASETPESAAHIISAQNKGFPQLLTLDRDDQKKINNRRRRSINNYLKNGGTPAYSGQDLDEYPFASTKENAGKADVMPIDTEDNRLSGARFGNQINFYRLVPNGVASRRLDDGSIVEVLVVA